MWRSPRYPNGAPTTAHVELSCADAIQAALAHASQAQLSRIGEEIASFNTRPEWVNPNVLSFLSE